MAKNNGGIPSARPLGRTATRLSGVTPNRSIGSIPRRAARFTMNIFKHPNELRVFTIAPATGGNAGGTVVTITGKNYLGATGVNFGGTPGTSFSVNALGTIITVTTPAKAAGTYDVDVLHPGNNFRKVGGFVFT